MVIIAVRRWGSARFRDPSTPSDGYAHLMLGRTLQRRSQHDEAVPHLRLAAAMGVATD